MKSNMLIAGVVSLGLAIPVFGQEVKKPEPPKAEAKKDAPAPKAEPKKDAPKKDPGKKEEKNEVKK